MHTVQRTEGSFSLVFSWKDLRIPTAVLFALNMVDVISTLYAVRMLGFIELNVLAVGFPAWIFVLKFGVCFIPVGCAYALDRFRMQNYLLLPFLTSVVLIEFYSLVVASCISKIIFR